MQTLFSPDTANSGGSCVQSETGRLFIQSFDAYGFQREFVMNANAEGFECHAYQHPGRREVWQVSAKEGNMLFAALTVRVSGQYASLLFNDDSAAGRPRNEGFVRFQEACFRGRPMQDLSAMV